MGLHLSYGGRLQKENTKENLWVSCWVLCLYQIEFYSEEKTELGGQRESDFSEKGVNGTSTIIKCTILYPKCTCNMATQLCMALHKGARRAF